MAIENNEADDEMKIVIKSKLTRRVLSSVIANAVNKHLGLGLDLKIDIKELVVSSSSDGTVYFSLSAEGAANKNEILKLINR